AEATWRHCKTQSSESLGGPSRSDGGDEDHARGVLPDSHMPAGAPRTFDLRVPHPADGPPMLQWQTMSQPGLFHISLAGKCRLLFGLAVALIIAAALFVPWYCLEALVHEANSQ